MKNDRKLFKCSICGNIVDVIEHGGGTLVCCRQNMQQLIPNSTDAAQEKHVPVIKAGDGKLTVEVGSTAHPMTEEHHISWIALAQGDNTQRVILEKTGSPSAQFCIGDAEVTVYAYCNLHGLWYAEL